jgi:hypothetical protein
MSGTNAETLRKMRAVRLPARAVRLPACTLDPFVGASDSAAFGGAGDDTHERAGPSPNPSPCPRRSGVFVVREDGARRGDGLAMRRGGILLGR